MQDSEFHYIEDQPDLGINWKRIDWKQPLPAP
jgi:hypothetical protein